MELETFIKSTRIKTSFFKLGKILCVLGQAHTRGFPRLHLSDLVCLHTLLCHKITRYKNSKATYKLKEIEKAWAIAGLSCSHAPGSQTDPYAMVTFQEMPLRDALLSDFEAFLARH